MLNLNPYFLKINHHNPIVFNLILWGLSFVVLLFSFTTNNNPAKIDYIYTGAFLTTIIIPVLINLYILIPKFLKQEKYSLYTLFFITNLILFTQLNIWFFEYLIDFIFPEYYFISYHSNTKLITIFGIFLIGTTLLKLSEDWFYFNRNENRSLKTKNKHILSQLATLRSQINPHFLFNSLNVIYALAVEKKEETKGAIIQLSDILRYVIYDSNTERVSLKDEIQLLKNYIEFQKLRHHQSENISFTQNVLDDSYLLYPMLLLPLLENSFKYGIKGDIKDTFININLTQNESHFHFYIENNYVESLEETTNSHSGLGLKTIKSNLDIVYPKKHAFKISKNEHKFIVSLKLFKNDH